MRGVLATIGLMKFVFDEFVVGNRTLAIKKADTALNQNDCQEEQASAGQ